MERGDGDGDGVRGVHGVSSQTTPDSSTAPPLTTGDSHAVLSSASKRSIRRFVITEKAPTIMAFSWLKAATTAFTFKTLLRHYAKQALTLWSLNVKLGPRHKGHKGQAGRLA